MVPLDSDALPVTIVLVDSTIADFMSPLPHYESVGVHVGEQEIARVMGADDQYGEGPLPRFLRAVDDAHRSGGPFHLVFLRDVHDPSDPAQQPELSRYGDHAIQGSDGVAFVPPLADMAARSPIVACTSLAVPTARLHAVLADILGQDVLTLTAAGRDRVRFVVCGCHTEIRVLSTAFKLRNELGFPHVYVSPHLVASRDRAGHVHALGVSFPDALVGVQGSLPALCGLLGLDARGMEPFTACRLEHDDTAEDWRDDERQVVQTLFLFDDEVHLKPLKGGFSGNRLLLATARRGGRPQAPVVVKVGRHGEIRREFTGHDRVRAYLGLHLPEMRHPVAVGETSGVVMALAAMDGRPRPLQALYDGGAQAHAQFRRILGRAVDILGQQLYAPTLQRRKTSPYQAFELTGPRHLEWLRKNLESILPAADLDAASLNLAPDVVVTNPLTTLPALLSHVDALDTDMVTGHGDLNLANIIVDDHEALWFIDWPFCRERPLEFDFAKMENDVKYVIDQSFEPSDLWRLGEVEHSLLAHLVPPAEPPAAVIGHASLEAMYENVRVLRLALASLKGSDDGAYLLVGLLRFALHTLSFNAALGRGDCGRTQLLHALLTVSYLAEALGTSRIHREGRRDRHPTYPERAAVPADCRPWSVDFPAYAPPMAPSLNAPPGAASVAGRTDESDDGDAQPHHGRVQHRNPLGRTGLEGRGWFFHLGPNAAVDAVVTRVQPFSQLLEFALIKREDSGLWGLPGAFVRDGESEPDAFRRVVLAKLGLDLPAPDVMERILVEDERNTDHAWVESAVFHCHLTTPPTVPLAARDPSVRDVAWMAVTADLARKLFASHAVIVEHCVRRIVADPPSRTLRLEPLSELLSCL